MFPRASLVPALLIGLVACAEASGPRPPASADAAADPAVPAASASSLPDFSGLLSDLAVESGKRLLSVRKGRDAGEELPTCLPSEIDYADTIYEAIERATAEDKPILLTSVVSKGGKATDPGCEV